MSSVKTLIIYFLYGLFLCIAMITGFALRCGFEIPQRTQQAVEAQKVYVFDLERAVKNMPKLINLTKDYNEKLSTLSAEIDTAVTKIEKVKNAKIGEDFTDVYLSSLKMKRDMIVEEYQKNVQAINNQMNEVLQDISKEYNAPIFNFKSLIVVTPEVIDVTDEVVSRCAK